MKVNARRIVQDIGIQVIARGANLALGVVVTLILARHLGTEGFGQWATLLTIIQLAATFSDLGLEPAVVSRAAADEEREGEWIGALVILRGALAIPATLISIGACAVIADTTDMFLAGVLLSLTLIASVPSALRAITQLRVRNDITMIALTTNSVLWALGVVLVAAHDGGIFAYATMFVASTFISAVVQAILSLRQRRGPLSTGRDLWREIVVTGISIGGAVVLISATSRAPQIFVYEMKGSTEAGLYAVAARLLDQSHFVPVALMTTLLPLLANSLKKDLEQAKDMLQRSLDLLLVISLPIVVVTYV
ncbi:MAG: oligosaccharide flippase family protein, partial [Solirubrobacteraceae bacterium]|nr:oligosaccharide flippase family protein [Solirubrobacteraceae bacterium]